MNSKSVNLALHLTVLLTLLLSVNVFARQITKQTTNTPSNYKMRKLVFPSQFSLGRLYVYKDPVDPHHYPESKLVAEQLGRFAGEAKGTLVIKVPEQGVVYLVASFQLTEQPDVLNRLDANVVDCLSFGGTGIMSDLAASIKPLSHLTGLRQLELSMCELSDDSLAPLKSLTNLEALTCFVTGISGTCFKDFSDMRKLTSLDLSANLLDGKTYGYLSKLQNLEALHLRRCGVRDSNMKEICSLQKVKTLSLNQSLVTGKGLAYLKNMKSLSQLSLTDVKVTTRELLMLKGTHLQLLKLPLPAYSAADMSLLQKTLPGTKLIAREGKVTDYEKTLYAPLH